MRDGPRFRESVTVDDGNSENAFERRQNVRIDRCASTTGESERPTANAGLTILGGAQNRVMNGRTRRIPCGAEFVERNQKSCCLKRPHERHAAGAEKLCERANNAQ